MTVFFSCAVVIDFLRSTAVHRSSSSDQLIALAGSVANRCFQLCRETLELSPPPGVKYIQRLTQFHLMPMCWLFKFVYLPCWDSSSCSSLKGPSQFLRTLWGGSLLLVLSTALSLCPILPLQMLTLRIFLINILNNFIL